MAVWSCGILEKQYLPQNLKLADVTPVSKNKDPTPAENYRPVHVLPTVSKVLERMIQKQLWTHIERLLPPYLCGYRKGLNTQFALISLIENGRKYLDNIWESFNGSVKGSRHNKPWQQAYGFSKDLLKILLSYLSDRLQRTKINQFLVRITTGCTQGSVLGQILFNIYINDLFYFLTCDICNFADDTTPCICNWILEYVLEKLEEYFVLAMEWFEINEMKMNA